MTESEIQDIKDYIAQTPKRVGNHSVWYYKDGSIGRIDPVGAGYGTAGLQKGVYFTIDAVLDKIRADVEQYR